MVVVVAIFDISIIVGIAIISRRRRRRRVSVIADDIDGTCTTTTTTAGAVVVVVLWYGDRIIGGTIAMIFDLYRRWTNR